MKHFFLLLIRAYRYFISPFMGIGAQCRFSPTCSAYAMQAFEHLPWYKAIPKVCWRLLRCQPFAKGGFDPLFPEKE